MTFPLRNVRRRDGLTLVELLVVVTILVMLVAVTIPLMKSVRSGSQLEAAVRKIESMTSAAKARAITNERPAGVVFIRDSVNPSISYEVALAESPPPYAGETNTAVNLQFVSNQIFFPEDGSVRPLRPIPVDTSSYAANDPSHPANDQGKWFVRPGDTIRFNFQGKRHFISEVTNKYRIVLSEPPYPGFTGIKRVHFQVFRSPRRTSAAPIQLPQGAFVKLSSCGLAADRSGTTLHPIGRFFSLGDVTLTFTPAGRIHRVYRGRHGASDKPIVQAAIDAGWDAQIAQRPFFDVTGALRIDLADGSPLGPTNAHRLVLHDREDRNSKSIVVAQMDQ